LASFSWEDVMKMVAAVVIAAVILGLIALIGMAVIIGASDDFYREFDDKDQEEYIQRWMEEKKKRIAQKKAKRRK